MNATPINSANAIDAVAFVIFFNRPFTEKEEAKLLVLKEKFKNELPDFSRTTKVLVKHEAGKVSEHLVSESGIKLQRFEPSGKIGWILNIIENKIVVTCQSYDRWDNVWELTDKYIRAALEQLELSSLTVQACVLQYVDRFTEKSGMYNILDVFDKKTIYLTSSASGAGKLWHVHQGWFDELTSGEKILNVLNLGTNEENGRIITTIDHSLQLQFTPKAKAAKKFFDNKEEYKKSFALLHENNKKVIKSLLNPKQRKAIGLV